MESNMMINFVSNGSEFSVNKHQGSHDILLVKYVSNGSV
jgi:hypothetical protein